MPRLVYLSGLALVVLALAFLVTDELTWRPGAKEMNTRRIRPGMTLEEAAAVLGETDAPSGGWFRGVRPLGPQAGWLLVAPGVGGRAYVEVDGDGRIVEARWYPAR